MQQEETMTEGKGKEKVKEKGIKEAHITKKVQPYKENTKPNEVQATKTKILGQGQKTSQQLGWVTPLDNQKQSSRQVQQVQMRTPFQVLTKDGEDGHHQDKHARNEGDTQIPLSGNG